MAANQGEAGDDNILFLSGREAGGAISGFNTDPGPQIDISDLPESNGLCDLVGTGGFDGTADVENGSGADLDLILESVPPPVDPAALQATPSSVAVTDLEQNDTFVVRNTDADASATSIEVSAVAADSEVPEFSVTSSTCTEELGPGESCTYTVVVNTRPERAGRVRLDYLDGTPGEDRGSTTVEVDIES